MAASRAKSLNALPTLPATSAGIRMGNMDRTPMGTWGRPDDIGWAAVFLSSEAAKFITGVSLPVDGGNSIGF